jgi:hypothetical protein
VKAEPEHDKKARRANRAAATIHSPSTRSGELVARNHHVLLFLLALTSSNARRGELVQFSTYIFYVLSPKSSSLSVPRHMASLVIIRNLKSSLEASIHKNRKHNNGNGNKTLDKNPRISFLHYKLNHMIP